MKRRKYQALVTALPQAAGESGAAVPGPGHRMVIRAHDHETQAARLFSALVTRCDDCPVPGSPQVIVTMDVLGDDVDRCLAPGETFTVWQGRDVGHGVVTRRVFV
jgi:hypothetical protein